MADTIKDIIRQKPQVGPVETKIQLNNADYAHLWFDNQEDQDHFDSLMRKKIYFQNSYGAKGEKSFINDGFKTTFGIFSKDFSEKILKNSDRLNRQLSYVIF